MVHNLPQKKSPGNAGKWTYEHEHLVLLKWMG